MIAPVTPVEASPMAKSCWALSVDLVATNLPPRARVERVDEYRVGRLSDQRGQRTVEQLFASCLDLAVFAIRVFNTKIDTASREGVVELVSAQVLPEQLESPLGVLVVA
jgi:hypothetical protein